MSNPRSALGAVRARLSYANVMATVAVFLALGGGAYAAVSLPRNSVGRAQIRAGAVDTGELANRAVTRSKLGTRSVGLRNLGRGAVSVSRLSPAVRAQLGRPGPAGPAGPKGDTGARGPAGPGAQRIHFAGTADPATTGTALDVPGRFQLTASCAPLDGATVAINLEATAPVATTLQATFTIDAGDEPAQPPNPGSDSIQTGSNQATVAPGATTTLGGPGVTTGYTRVNARAILTSADGTITLDLVEIVDAGTGQCSLDGTAVAAS